MNRTPSTATLSAIQNMLADEGLNVAHDTLANALADAAAGHDQPEPLPALMTRAQVAQALRVTTRTITNLQVRGKLPAHHLSRRCVRFRRDDVLALITHAHANDLDTGGVF